MGDKILYSSDQAAVHESRTLTGWWSGKSTYHKTPVFWGEDEHLARWDGCTHKICDECGKNEHRKMYTCCQECRAKHAAKKYAEFPKKQWDGESLIVIHETDQYFRDMEEVLDYCDENECSPENLMLCHCEGVKLREVDICDHLYDDMADEQGPEDIPEDIMAAAEALNDAIRDAKPMCYRQENVAVEWPAAKEE